MSVKLRFIALPIVLLVIAFIGRLTMGAMGASYDSANRIFSMVILQIHLALIWGALARRHQGWGIGGALMSGLLIGLVSQILILVGTAASYLFGVQTYFVDPTALNVAEPVGFAQAMGIRAFGLMVNCVLSMVAASIGFALSSLVPAKNA